MPKQTPTSKWTNRTSVPSKVQSPTVVSKPYSGAQQQPRASSHTSVDLGNDCLSSGTHTNQSIQESAEIQVQQTTPKLLPQAVSVKVSKLRSHGYNNLKEWMETPGNILVTRAGRISMKDTTTGEKKVIGYKASPWANPFKLKDYSLEEALAKYAVHLRKLVEDSARLEEFMKLADAREIGCFCLPQEGCHRDEILKLLKEKQQQ
ncbi:UNVERIFIED_CONTAM: hypothetical protein HDU68_002522 [Siphonaria sp. JEL0065]|nr:hypothetical protein HDU68_002522 [Siphonaria sp. JEL0065]